MKRVVIGTGTLLLTAMPAMSAGIERSTQSIGILFEEGNYAEASAQFTNPDVSGKDTLGFNTKNVAEDFDIYGFGYKHQFTDQISAALIIEHPYGADVNYATPENGGSVLLGGTSANVESSHISGVLRYKFDDAYSVYGGLRMAKVSGTINLRGAAYGPVSGYRARFDNDNPVGWLVGGSWERPDIAARISLTYYSDIEHDLGTTESLNGQPVGRGTTTIKTPEAIALDFQTGVATDTLVYGQIRRVNWSEFQVAPEWFTGITGSGLISLEDSTIYTLGVARKFTDQWSGTAAVVYEPEESDDLVSPLSPTNGRLGLTVAGIYTVNHWKFTGGINYTKLGDAQPETGTPDTARAKITDSDAISLGLKVGYRF